MAKEETNVTEVAKPQELFSVALTSALDEVNDALPNGFNKTRFVQNAVALLNNNEQLQKFAQEHGTTQIKAGLMRSAFLGLDALNKEVYLVQYGKDLNMMISYTGNIKLCKKYSIRPIKDIYAKVVREGDDFEETIVDGHQSVNFKPKAFNDGKIVGAFAVCIYEDGGVVVDSMSLAELENTRKSSKAPNSPAWTKFTGEMYKKTILHRLCKYIELDFDSADAKMYFDDDMAIETDTKTIVKNNASNDSGTEEFIDVDAEVVDE